MPKNTQFKWTLESGYINNLVKKKFQLSCILSVASVGFPIALTCFQKEQVKLIFLTLGDMSDSYIHSVGLD